MVLTTCVHEEQIKELGDGIQEGLCPHCGQTRRYDLNDTVGTCRVILLGRRDGKIVIPNMGEKLDLSDEEREELAEALAEAKKPLPVQEPVESTANGKLPRRPRDKRKLHQYYEKNKDAIIADYYVLKLKDFFHKWRFASATWTRLKTEWEVKAKGPPLKGPRKPREPSPVSSVSSQSTDQLPQFPPFNDEWTSDVQIAWLETYKALRLGKEVMKTR